MMHNDLAEEIADRMKDAGCRDVMLEPDLLPVDGEAFELKTANKQDDARSDIRAEGFWGKQRRAFFDVMVFAPYARSYSTRSLKAIYAEHEGRKNREYKERILKVKGGLHAFGLLLDRGHGSASTGGHPTTGWLAG